MLGPRTASLAGRIAWSALAITTACGGPTEDTGPQALELRGAVQKGPFVIGSTIGVSPLVSATDLNPTGTVFNTSTINDLGEFELSLEAPGPVRLEGTGFYYNEITGGLSTGNLTLRALYIPSGAGVQTAYVNLITHLTIGRIEALVEGGTAFGDAVVQAERELVAALAVTPPGFDPGARAVEMNIAGGDTPGNQYLFVVSSVLAQVAYLRDPDAPDAQLQELINSLSIQFASGNLGSEVRDEIGRALMNLDLNTITRNFNERLDDTGSSARAPNVRAVIDSDRDGFADEDDTCPRDVDPDQADGDADGIGDACDRCPETACEQGCIPASNGDPDRCVKSCESGEICAETEACIGIAWRTGTDANEHYAICAPTCNPLADSCESGQRCERTFDVAPGTISTDGPRDPSGGGPGPASPGGASRWSCVPTPTSSVDGAEGADCAMYVGACAPGLVCDWTEVGQICVRLCDPTDADACGGDDCRPIGGFTGGEGPLPPPPTGTDGTDPDAGAPPPAGDAGAPATGDDGGSAPDGAVQSGLGGCVDCAVGHCPPPPGGLGDRCFRFPNTCGDAFTCTHSSLCADGPDCCHAACSLSDASCPDASVCIPEFQACVPEAALGDFCQFPDECAEGGACARMDGCGAAGQCCVAACDPAAVDPCGEGFTCSPNRSLDRSHYLCVPTPASCTNGARDSDESDVDCGGGSDCEPCGSGAMCWPTGPDGVGSCAPDLECMGNVCLRGCDASVAETGCELGEVCVENAMASLAPGFTGDACLPVVSEGERCRYQVQCGEALACAWSEGCGSANCCVPACDYGVDPDTCADGTYCAMATDALAGPGPGPGPGPVPGGGTGPGGCVSVPAHCTNGTRDADETGTDCGASCTGCPVGSGCGSARDCVDGLGCTFLPGTMGGQCTLSCDPSAPVCESGYYCRSQWDPALGQNTGACVPLPASCSNGTTDFDESDTDCGGSSPCGPCGAGDFCTTAPQGPAGPMTPVWPEQCIDGYVCFGGTCVLSFCNSGTENGNESDVDCGGACDDCTAGQDCENDDNNCASRQCLGPVMGNPYAPPGGGGPTVCAPEHCGNGAKDEDETDRDCGGSCDRCERDKACLSGDDCASNWCNAGFCDNPNCFDSVQNGYEADTDCGAVCGTACSSGDSCIESRDCSDIDTQGSCVSGTCASCTDATKNGTETDVDCGGTGTGGPMCPRCQAGDTCLQTTDCEGFGASCEAGVCRSCGDGVQNGNETGVDCGGNCPMCPP